jgi:endonuclease YncB( thermonuclease family)
MAGIIGLLPLQTQAATVSGPPLVIDGDTLEIAGQRVRLFGIDAPELSQTWSRSGQAWECGKAAREHLAGMISTAEVTCSGAEKDTYGRLVAVCQVSGVDLNRALVAEGWATAFRRYSDRYRADETRAQAAKLGIWRSSFVRPEEYRTAVTTPEERRVAPQRHAAPTPANAARAQGCVIKGNHSRRGEWIYHLPGMPYYAQTRAEAMFCSEAEARAAGYRRAIVR